jgi:hypothetical protein
MRSALQNEAPTKNIVTNPKWAALFSSILVLPFAILESLNQAITRQNAPGVILLFGVLWLLPIAFIVILVPIVQAVRAGPSLMANPISFVQSRYFDLHRMVLGQPLH